MIIALRKERYFGENTPLVCDENGGHTISQITEMYYVKKDTSRLNGITDGIEI